MAVLEGTVLRARSLGYALGALAVACRAPSAEPIRVPSQPSVPADTREVTPEVTPVGRLASSDRLSVYMTTPRLELPDLGGLKELQIQCREYCSSIDWKAIGRRLPEDTALWILGSSSTVLMARDNYVVVHYVASPTGKETCASAPAWVQDLFDLVVARNPALENVHTEEGVALDALPGLGKLRALAVPATQLACIPPLPELQTLTLLGRAEPIDVAGIARFPKLRTFAATHTESTLTSPLELRDLSRLTLRPKDPASLLRSLKSAPLAVLELHGDLPDATEVEPFAPTLQSLTVEGRVGPTRPLTKLRELVDLHVGPVEDLDILRDAPKLQRLIAGAVSSPPPKAAAAPALLHFAAKSLRTVEVVRSMKELVYVDLELTGRANLSALGSLPKLNELILSAPTDVPDRSRVDAAPLARSPASRIELSGCFANPRAIVGRARSMVQFPGDAFTLDELMKLMEKHQAGYSLDGTPCRTPKPNVIAQ